MTALSTRDALAKALCDRYHECAETWSEPMSCNHGFAYRDADHLLASGAVVDAATLADDEAVERGWAELNALGVAATMRVPSGWTERDVIRRLLAAALSERSAS